MKGHRLAVSSVRPWKLRKLPCRSRAASLGRKGFSGARLTSAVPTSSAMPASMPWAPAGSSRHTTSTAAPAARPICPPGVAQCSGSPGEKKAAAARVLAPSPSSTSSTMGHGLHSRIMLRAVSPTATSWLAAMAASTLTKRGGLNCSGEGRSSRRCRSPVANSRLSGVSRVSSHRPRITSPSSPTWPATMRRLRQRVRPLRGSNRRPPQRPPASAPSTPPSVLQPTSTLDGTRLGRKFCSVSTDRLSRKLPTIAPSTAHPRGSRPISAAVSAKLKGAMPITLTVRSTQV